MTNAPYPAILQVMIKKKGQIGPNHGDAIGAVADNRTIPVPIERPMKELDRWLFELTWTIAHSLFDEPDDEYVLALYERVEWNHRHGLTFEGVTTVH